MGRGAAPIWGDDENQADWFSLFDLRVDGEPAAHTLDKQFVKVPLAQPLAPGATAHLTFGYEAHLPVFRTGAPQSVRDANLNPGTYGAIDNQTHGLSPAIPVAVADPNASEMQFILWDATVTLEAMLGPYPFPQLEILPLTMTQSGMNRSGLIMLDRFYLSNRTGPPPAGVTDPWLRQVTSVDRREDRRRMLAHELAHGWCGDLVWQSRQGPSWMEGLSEALAIAALERAYGPGAAEAARTFDIYVYRLGRANGLPDVASGRPRSETMSVGEYHAMSYYKPALFYDQMRRSVGDDAFFGAMRQYIERNRFSVAADRGPIEALLDNPEVNTLHQRWLLETHGDEDVGVLTPEQMKQLGLGH